MGTRIEKMSPSNATRYVNECARSRDFCLIMKSHASDRLLERDLLQADLMYLLKNGFIYKDCEPATKPDICKYTIEGTTPNSNGRTICAVVIPAPNNQIKIVTIFWKDEK